MLRPTTKRERDVKCVQVHPRKKVKSTSPAARTGTGTDTDDTSKRSELLACPFYKHDPTRYMDCLLRNRLTSTSFVRQHLQRAHSQPIHCSCCGLKFRKEVELNYHVRQVQCKPTSFTYPGFSMDILMQIRKPPRDLDERGRWNSMWKILFPCEPCPKDPYVGSAQEEILGIARCAVEAASPDTSPEVLQILNWDAVSAIYTRHSVDKTSPPSSQDSWPPTPESMDGDQVYNPSVLAPVVKTTVAVANPTTTPSDNEPPAPSFTSLQMDEYKALIRREICRVVEPMLVAEVERVFATAEVKVVAKADEIARDIECRMARTFQWQAQAEPTPEPDLGVAVPDFLGGILGTSIHTVGGGSEDDELGQIIDSSGEFYWDQFIPTGGVVEGYGVDDGTCLGSVGGDSAYFSTVGLDGVGSESWVTTGGST